MDGFPDLDSLLELRFLKLNSYPVLKLVDVTEGVEPENRDSSPIRRSQAFDAFEGGRFAGPVRADEAEDLAIVDFERDIIDRNDRFVRLSKSRNLDDCAR